MNNLAIVLKKKRDDEARLARTSPQTVFNDDGTEQTWGGGSAYTLPQATETTLGGIKIAERTTESAEVKIDPVSGKPYAPAAGEATNGLPTGGAIGQVLKKNSITDYDAIWDDADAATNGIPTGGTTNQLLAKNSDTNYDGKWVDAPSAANGIPSGGTAGQILSKIDATDYNSQWIDAPSGGTYYENSIDEPPASPSAWDDEFDDASLNVKWTRLKSSFGTITEQGNRLIISGTGASGDNGTGILQAIPSGDFSLTASLKSILSYGGSSSASGTGLILAADTSDATSFIRFTVNIEGSMVLSAQRWTNLTSWGADLYKTTLHYDRRAYLRIRRVSTTYYFDVSFTGDSWLTVYSPSSIVITPAYIGLLGTTKVSNFSSVFDWFRVTQ